MRQYEIEAVLTRFVTVLVEATDPTHASELFASGAWDSELGLGETTNWRAVGKPKEIR